MMTYFKEISKLTEEEKKQVSEQTGKIVLWILEGKDIYHMADELKLEPHQVAENVFEDAYQFIKLIGIRFYLKLWFHKRCWKK